MLVSCKQIPQNFVLIHSIFVTKGVMKNQRRLLYAMNGENEQRSQSNLLKFLM